MGERFLLVGLTTPAVFDGEVELLEGLLEAGLDKLHIRKFNATAIELENLLGRLSSRWATRLVLHGSREVAARYGVGQIHVHGALGVIDEGIAVSTSVHSWEEFLRLPDGMSYAFISPLFDSISKRGYMAGEGLLKIPEERLPCLPVGLGGIGADTIGEMVRYGWKGAAMLGWLWDEPARAVERFVQLKKIIDGERTGDRGV